jgi:type II secretory pathway pseudopilin PulG
MQFPVPSSQFPENLGDGVQLRTENRELRTSTRQNSCRGYILITLMLFITLLAMAALAVLPKIAQQAQRDREEEMLHRGTEYMRAIKKYYKKFGRYPSRVEELENTNQIRFLRKRFKDPLVTDAKEKGEKDFKFVRQGDPILNMLGLGGVGQGASAGVGQGLNPQAAAALGQQLQTGKPPGGAGVAGVLNQITNNPLATGLPGQQNLGTQTPATGDSENSDTPADGKTGDAKSAASSNDSGAPGGQVFGGGPILGVASTSKAKTIREFNKKNHYNEWVFIYDPQSDRGGLLKGPIQPDATGRGIGIGQTGGPQGVMPGQGQGLGQGQGQGLGGPGPGPQGTPPQQQPPEDQ